MDWLSPAAWPDATDFDREQIALSGRKRAAVASHMPDLAGLRVLDVGCWTGYQTLAMAAAGASATGIDVKPDRLAVGTALAEKHGLDARFEVRNLFALAHEPEPERFDLVWCAGVYHHLAWPAYGIYSLAWASADWLFLEGRTDAHPWAQVRRVEPHAGDYSTVWTSIPTPRWVEGHLKAAGFELVATVEHYENDRTIFVARRKPVLEGDEQTNVDALPAGIVVSLPLWHPILAAVESIPPVHERWPIGGIPDRGCERMVTNWTPGLCTPLMIRQGALELVDGAHRLTVKRWLAHDRTLVLIVGRDELIPADGAEVF